MYKFFTFIQSCISDVLYIDVLYIFFMTIDTMACGHALTLYMILLLLYLAGDVERCPGPWKQQNFTIVHQNIRGLFGKKDLLTEYIVKNNFKLFAVTETLLNSSTPSAFVNCNGYLFERRDRGHPGGGGVGFYIKNGIDYTRRIELETPEL